MTPSLAKLEKPLAIAMWDFSWILRHHRYGEFEDWERCLGELVERGYDAIRIDTMPQYVATDSNGQMTERFRSIREDWTPLKWGNDFSMEFCPRQALLEFLPLCERFGVKVALSSWYIAHSEKRQLFREAGAFLRAWEETLHFLQEHDLLNNVIYIDLLNEFPFWHGYDWLKLELDARSEIKQFRIDAADANVPDNVGVGTRLSLNAEQKTYCNAFIHEHLSALKKQFPKHAFFFSFNHHTPLDALDLTLFDAIDDHHWFADSGKLPHLDALNNLDQRADNQQYYRELRESWQAQKSELIAWLEGRIAETSQKGQALGIPVGNTEGWGPVGWLDHPDLDWDWVKEAGEIAVNLCKQHDNYKFICTSNFTHPQFRGMWEDVSWHRRITDIIKS